MNRARVAVVGGGISGLAAAYRLRTLLGPDAEIVLIDGSRRFGGALRTVELAGLALDVGAEAFLMRRPEAVSLIEELGLRGQLTHPTPAAPTVWVAGRTAGLPTRTVLGLPGAATDVAGLLSAQGVAKVAAEPTVALSWEPGDDASVGLLLRERAGDELVDRLVDPLLGGVYAGRADALGLRATLPAVAGALDRGAGSLLAAAAAVLAPQQPAPSGRPVPVFGTLRGGLGGLVDALVAAAAVRPRLGAPVRGLARISGGWRVELGSHLLGRASPEYLDADAVLLAVPAPAVRRLLVGPLPLAAAAAGRVEIASSAVVGLALPLPAAQALPPSSGVLVAASERQIESLSVKAFTFSGRKWAHASSPEVMLVRASLGRHGEVRVLQRDDAELIEMVRADLAALTGITAAPVDTVVARWGGGLPQYAPGHVAAIAALENAVAQVPGLAVAGAMLHGIGVPACIGTADAAARRIAAHLGAGAPAVRG
ncbi:MAG: protoporphyrinogen oxidase [Pseudonocardiaceae bacterium]